LAKSKGKGKKTVSMESMMKTMMKPGTKAMMKGKTHTFGYK